ncbi:MAG: ECF transporter S component [Streptococcaceae bacterium]|jgi:hypothetical protein|nr:ECF transporter S component [Streptococcaceae bacterium]
MTLNRLTRIALLAALASVLRLVFGAWPNVKPITALFFVIILSFGLLEAIAVSALTMLVTGFLMGFSVIVLGQIISYALILILGVLGFKVIKGLGFRIGLVFVLTLLYGAAMALFTAPLFASPILAFWLSGLTFDLTHAVSTALFFPILLTIFKNSLKKDLI